MGEWSKSVGEFGEKTVENFLKLIGWGELPRNISINCLKSKEHIANKNPVRETHGIDFYFSYLSPLADSTLMNIHISSKYTAGIYPNSPVRFFKDYVQELAWGAECFKYSSEKRNLSKNLRGYKHVEEIGILFWLSNDQETYDDLSLRVVSANLTMDGPISMVYLVDNKRISFIVQALLYAKQSYPNHQITFFYPNTGKNVIPSTKIDFGKLLPVEYINSSILPLRISNTTGVTGLMLFSIDSFSYTDLAKLIGLAQDLSKSWAAFINISFPNYDQLLHAPDVREIKMNFNNVSFTEKVLISSYTTSFKSINI